MIDRFLEPSILLLLTCLTFVLCEDGSGCDKEFDFEERFHKHSKEIKDSKSSPKGSAGIGIKDPPP